MGAIKTTGQYGLAIGLLYNAFVSFTGDEDSGFGVDNIKSIAETMGVDPKFLEEGSAFSDIFKGREGPLSLIGGSLFASVLPTWMKTAGVIGGILWGGMSLIQDGEGKKLLNAFTGAASGDVQKRNTLELSQEEMLALTRKAMLTKAKADIRNFPTDRNAVAQVEGHQNVEFSSDGPSIAKRDDDSDPALNADELHNDN